jgi:hypothetical protein
LKALGIASSPSTTSRLVISIGIFSLFLVKAASLSSSPPQTARLAGRADDASDLVVTQSGDRELLQVCLKNDAKQGLPPGEGTRFPGHDMKQVPQLKKLMARIMAGSKCD